MELFVYNWVYTGYTVYGHCLDEGGQYVNIKVRDFFPSCYVEGETVPRSSIVPRFAEFGRMLSSTDVSTPRSFYRLQFNNAQDMASFAREQRCYMADIPQVAAFLSRTGADHVGWVTVPMRDVRMADIVSVPERIPPPTPRVMAFDIEVRSSDSGMPRPYRIMDTVEMISVVMFGGGVPVEKHLLHTGAPLRLDGVTDTTFDDEIALITGFFDLIIREDPTVITGFNIYGFDMHYLVSRLKLRLVEIPPAYRGASGSVDVVKVDWSSDAYGHNNYDRLVIGGRVIVDLYLYFRRMKLDKYSLDFVSGKFLGEGKNDMPHADMAAAFATGDRDALRRVALYCVQDSVLVMKLFDKVQMWIDVCEIAKITRCGIEDIYTRGEQMKMISQCVAECEKRRIVLQPQPASEWRPYEGAYVLEPTKGVYDGCSVVDFQSLYPSIIIAYNICPSTYVKDREGRHRFLSEPIGLLPGMIKRILDERKRVKAQIKMIDAGSVEHIVLDRRQNALKICANSVYGMMGFQKSRYFGHMGCAESVTTAGRELLSDTVDKIERDYPVRVIYGDSVTGYTPTIVRIQKKFVLLETFENLATKWGGDEWAESDGKQSCELYGVEVWTEEGWTMLHRVIRHQLPPHKQIVRVLTHTGLVDVTDEHSLLSRDGELVDAGSVEAGYELMHYLYPPLHDAETSISPDEARIFGMFCGDGSCGTYDCPSSTWAINNADLLLLSRYKSLCKDVYEDYTWVVMDTMKSYGSGVYKLSPRGDVIALAERYRSLMYRKAEKTVPHEILNSSLSVRQAFWDGLYDADGDKNGMQIDQKHQINIASFAMLASSIGYSISLNTRTDKPDVFRLTVTKAKRQRNPIAVKKVHTIEYTGYVYDVTTSNHHFQAGPGQMIVHNTDSCILWHDDDKDKQHRTDLAELVCSSITAALPEPMALKFETYCDKVILLTKKRYVLVAGDRVLYKGVMTARRDYCRYAKDTYSRTLQMVAEGASQQDISDYIDMRIMRLLSGRADVDDLVVTKSIARRLATYKVNQPHVVLARRLVEKTGVDIPPGTRLEYVYVTDVLRMVTPEEFKEENFEIDGMHYVKKQLATQIDDVLSAVGMGEYIKNEWAA